MKILPFILLFTAMSIQARAQKGIAPSGLWADSSTIFSKKVPAIFYSPTRYDRKVVKEIPKDLYTRNFGFFCRQELNMHQAHVPVSFRIGSMEDCNRMEDKSGSR